MGRVRAAVLVDSGEKPASHFPTPSEAQAGYLAALAERPRDSVGRGVNAQLGFQVREPVANRVQAEAQLPRDVRLFLDRERGTEHLFLARRQTKAIQCVGADRRAATGR